MVLVWISLMLFTLLSVAGFAVDMGNWWFQATKLQRAVDAGAHAGAVFLPGNVAEAKIKARTETARNNFNDGILAGTPNATVFVEQLANPYQLRVQSTIEVDNFFLSLVGLKTPRRSPVTLWVSSRYRLPWDHPRTSWATIP